MPRTAGSKVERTFVKGLITEATGLNFPPDSCTDTYNCIFDEKGRVTRRLGIEWENSTPSFNVFDRSAGVTTEFYWENAGSTGVINLVVVQIKNMLYFYKEAIVGITDGYTGLSINLNTYAAGATTNIPLYNCQFTSTDGKLFIVHPLCDPFYITYDNSIPSVTGTKISILVRDQVGDTSDVLYADAVTRPVATVGTIPTAHLYNLYNQGWFNSVKNVSGSTTNPVAFWDSVLTTLPGNGDVWWLSKNTSDVFDPVNFSDTVSIGSTLAPKGFFIMNPFDTNRTSLSGVSSLVDQTSGGLRPSCIAAFAGRIWYAGTNAAGYSQKLYFSQVVVKQTEYGNCYSANDPTSSQVSDLLASDGGVISIPTIGTVIKLFHMGPHLLVFGTGGVYSISGSTGLGFSATDYSVSKISATPAISPLSFVDVYGAPFWWNTDGIYTIEPTSNMYNYLPASTGAAKSLTDHTVKTFLAGIHPSMMYFVKGAFNRHTKVIQWIYKSVNAPSLETSFEYDSALSFNTLTGAFYPWNLPVSNPTINGIVSSRTQLLGLTDVLVTTSGGATVTTLGGDEVHAHVTGNVYPNYFFRYLATNKTGGSTYSTSFAQSYNNTYKDWGNVNTAIDYSSYFFTSYQLDGDGLKFFQNNYVLVFADTASNSSCYFQPWWEYSTSSLSARVGNPQQVYANQNLLFTTIEKRLKVRGKGRAVQFKFYSASGLPFSITGWTIYSLINTTV